MSVTRRNFGFARHLRLADIPATVDFQQRAEAKERARDVGSSEPVTPTGGNPVDVEPTLPKLHKLDADAPDEMRASLEERRVARIAPEILEEFGVSRLSQLAGHIEDARRELLEGMKLVDRPEERDLHVWVGQLINSVDDLRCHMATRDRGDAA